MRERKQIKLYFHSEMITTTWMMMIQFKYYNALHRTEVADIQQWKKSHFFIPSNSATTTMRMSECTVEEKKSFLYCRMDILYILSYYKISHSNSLCATHFFSYFIFHPQDSLFFAASAFATATAMLLLVLLLFSFSLFSLNW